MQPASLSGGELGQHRPHLLCAVNWKPSCEPYAGQASSFAASPGRMSTACSGPPTATPPPSRRTRGLAGLDGFGRGQERVGRSVSASDGVRIGCCEAGSGRPSRHLENPARTIPGCVRKGSGESAVDRLGGAPPPERFVASAVDHVGTSAVAGLSQLHPRCGPILDLKRRPRRHCRGCRAAQRQLHPGRGPIRRRMDHSGGPRR